MVVVANEFTHNGNLRIPQPQVQQIVNIMLVSDSQNIL